MVYVITGGPGFGKSTLIGILATRGFKTGCEAARELLVSKEITMEQGVVSYPGSATTDTFQIPQNFPSGEVSQAQLPAIPSLPIDFERAVATARINFVKTIEHNAIAFSDRGLPDQIAYSWYKGKRPSAFIEAVTRENKYAPFVFVTPPWQEIYHQDEIRKESFTEATAIHRNIVNAYLKYDYKIIELPRVTPDLRVEFILDFLRI